MFVSKTKGFWNSSKFRESDVTPPALDHDRAPEPLVFRYRLEPDPSAPGQVYVTLFNVVAPDILAVPPTSSLVLVVPPELIPRLPVVISNPVDEEAPPEIVIKPSAVIVPIPVRLPVADISQSLVSIKPVSPLSPRMKRPDVWKLPEIEALPSKKTLPSTSRAPEIKRSLAKSRSLA